MYQTSLTKPNADVLTLQFPFHISLCTLQEECLKLYFYNYTEENIWPIQPKNLIIIQLQTRMVCLDTIWLNQILKALT